MSLIIHVSENQIILDMKLSTWHSCDKIPEITNLKK